MPTDINRGTTGVNLPPSVSADIIQGAEEQSAVMRLARRVNLPGNGQVFPIITGDPVAAFVGETDAKPVSRGTLANKVMRAYKIAVIEPFSMEFRRDLPGLYNAMRGRLPGALALAFDNAALHGIGAPTGDFSTLASATAVVFTGGTTNVFTASLQVLSNIATAGGEVTGWGVNTQGQIAFLGALGTDGKPIFYSDLQNTSQIGSVLGAPVVRARNAGTATTTPDTVGIAGDWNRAVWGTVEGIQIDISDQATLTDGGTTINLWQQNMFAVRAEMEVGFLVEDVKYFNRLTLNA